MAVKVRKLSYALGAEVMGVDLTKPLDDGVTSEIRNAFLEHCLIVFRGQSFTREHQVAFCRRFGEVDQNVGHRNKHPEVPEITSIVSRPGPNGEAATGRYEGKEWHTDHSHLQAPSMASLLHAIEIPEIGGDTQFCNMYRAYETLSDGMKKLLEGLHGVHMETRITLDNSSPEAYAESRRLNPSTAHPVVRVHPETGRKALYISEQVKLLVGMTAEESKPLIQFLVGHSVRPQNVYRHRWQKHDFVMWDNRCLLHIALADYDRTKVRHMEKSSIDGDQCGQAYHGALQ